ncbi:MAG: hypothetical protein RJB38_2172 [Pseudomonadota bacterium]
MQNRFQGSFHALLLILCSAALLPACGGGEPMAVGFQGDYGKQKTNQEEKSKKTAEPVKSAAVTAKTGKVAQTEIKTLADGRGAVVGAISLSSGGSASAAVADSSTDASGGQPAPGAGGDSRGGGLAGGLLRGGVGSGGSGSSSSGAGGFGRIASAMGSGANPSGGPTLTGSDSPAVAMSGAAAAARGGRGGGGSGDFGAAFGGLLGGGGDSGGAAGSGSQNFGGENGGVSPLGSSDPGDYFTRLGMTENLFKIVERRYRNKATHWVRMDLDATAKRSRVP